MDAPESPSAGVQPAAAPAAGPYEQDSPVFDFINALSPIQTLKPPNSVQPVQLFKPTELPLGSSIFTSPSVNSDTGSQLTATRDGSGQHSQEGFIANCQMSQTGTLSSIEMLRTGKGSSESCITNYSVNKALHQSQLASNGQFFYTLTVTGDNMPMDNGLLQHQYGNHRRILFDDKIGASSMSVQNVLNPHPASICTGNYRRLAGSPDCVMPGVGLHLNAVTSISKETMPYNNQASGDPYNIIPFTINSPLQPERDTLESVIASNNLAPSNSEVDTSIQSDRSSQKTTPNANESGKENRKKRRKFQNGDDQSCRRCSCKRSKCLKLYCACFAAKVYCSECCSCQGCLNNRDHEEEVLCIRKQIESRNPLAFAPAIIRTCGSNQEFGDNSNKTPASARHKRGCNCKRSYCLKKYCECFQIGVGCSISCRCESCKNSFGRREGVELLKGKDTSIKEDKTESDKQHVVDQSSNLPSSENLLTSPLNEPCRSLVLNPSTFSKLPLPSVGCSSPQHNSHSPMKTDALISPVNSAEMILGNIPSDGQPHSPCTVGVKVMSPNKKRVSPIQIGTSLSPINRTGRKLILDSIPSFPSLSGDANTERN